MSTRVKKLMFLLIVIIAVFCLGACVPTGTDSEISTNIVIVGGVRANQPIIDTSKLEEVVEKSAGSAGTVSIISVEGESKLIGTVSIPVIKRNIDPNKRKSMIGDYTNQILSLVRQSKAGTEEADCLSALQLASRQLAACEGDKYLIIMDNGLSTTGALDMTKFSLANMDVEDIVRNLKENEEIPSLNDIPVYWAGLGQCAGVQKKLRNKEYNRLTELWTAILEESGTSVNMLTDVSVGDQIKDDLPSVKPVAVSEPVSIFSEADNSVREVEKIIKKQKSEIIISEETALFQPDSAKLKSSKKKLASVLKPIAEYLQADSSNQIVLIATTASAGNVTGNDSKSIILSEKRAETIKKIILSFNSISSDQIKTAGLGYQKAVKGNFAVKDVDSFGKFMENKGALNRQVIITSVDSDRGKMALDLKKDGI